jgi:hypothetical protein
VQLCVRTVCQLEGATIYVCNPTAASHGWRHLAICSHPRKSHQDTLCTLPNIPLTSVHALTNIMLPHYTCCVPFAALRTWSGLLCSALGTLPHTLDLKMHALNINLLLRLPRKLAACLLQRCEFGVVCCAVHLAHRRTPLTSKCTH